jgi:gamma-glutamylcyclotransferase (GGCT)/AIG2-like uncharacterized protein YtfP
MTYRNPKTGRWATRHHNVFVYGTLKRGNRNNYLLKDAEYIGTATTVANYQMIHVGYPVIMMDTGTGHPVAGEVYRVGDSVLKNLDMLESVGYSYDRNTIECSLNEGRSIEQCRILCFVYEGRPDRWGLRFTNEFVLPANDYGELEWTHETLAPSQAAMSNYARRYD